MNHRQRLYLSDLLNRIERIEHYTQIGREAFLASQLHQDGVILNFEVVGEIIKRVAPEFIAQHPQVDWSGFAKFRDFLAHQYEKIQAGLIWEYVQEDVPSLKMAVIALLQTNIGDAPSSEDKPSSER